MFASTSLKLQTVVYRNLKEAGETVSFRWGKYILSFRLQPAERLYASQIGLAWLPSASLSS